MPTFEITSPDGRVFHVDGPDGSTGADALKHIQSQLGPPATANQSDSWLPQTLNFAGMDTGIPLPKSIGTGIVGAGKTVNDLVAGVKQGYNYLTGDTAANAKLAQDQAAGAQAYAPLEQAHPVASFVGQAAPLIAALPAVGGVGGAAALGALPGLVGYGDPGQRLMAGGIGALGNIGGYGAGKLFGKLLGPGTADSAAAVGNPWGIPLRAAQVSDSAPLKIVDSVLSNLPGSGQALNAAKDQTLGGFNHAVGQMIGTDTTQLTPEIIGAAKSAAGKAIGDISGRNTLVYTDALNTALDAAKQRAGEELVGNPAQQAIVTGTVDRIMNSVAPDMTMPGTTYKSFDSVLGKMAKNNTGTVSDILGDVRSSLRDAMDASISPQDATAWAKARHDYFNSIQVGNAAKATPGSLSPAQLLGAVNQSQRNARFGAGNDLAQLAQWAKPTLPDLVPNSGTAQREWYQKLLTSPLATLGGAGGAAYGVHELGGDMKDAAVGGLLGIPLLALLGKGAGSQALASYMARAPISGTAQKMLQMGGMGLLGAPAMTAARQ